ETQLARAELNEKLNEASSAIALLAGAAVLAIPALVILLQAAAIGLEEAGLDPAIAALIIGAAVFIIAVILAVVGLRRLKAERLTPTRTLRQLQKDAHLATHPARSTP